MTTDRNENQMLIERPPEELHQLKNKWAFWSLKYDRSKDWNDCLKKVAVIETVEDFWNLYLQLSSASKLPPFSDYYLFKEGIEPKWEDPENIKGGRWVVSISTQKRDHDEMWLTLMMLLLCEEFGNYGEFICGASFNAREGIDKFALWTSDATLDVINNRIASIFATALGIFYKNLHYEPHQDVSDRSKSNKKQIFFKLCNEVPLRTENQMMNHVQLKTEH